MDNESDKPIGVFDSGVGGLSILIELKKLLPKENFVYLADQAEMPYGEKSTKQLIGRATKITKYFIKNHQIKILVVACNTATTSAVKALRDKFFLPIVGTIPALKPASRNSKTGVIAVLSTIATAKSNALKKLIKDECQNTKVINIESKNLVEAVEAGESGGSGVTILLKKYLKEIKSSDADYLVLGCTHYPFLKNTIQKIVGSRVKLLDSGEAIAKNTKTLLIKNKLENKKSKRGKTLYYTTGKTTKFQKVADKLLKTKVVAFSTNL